MSNIYFNQEVIKPLSDTVVLNYFIEQGTKKTVYIRDTRQIKYPNGSKQLNGGVDFYIRDNDYYIDITDGDNIGLYLTDFGVFVGEGFSFEIKSSKDPIFTVAQKETEFAAASNIYKQNLDVKEMMLGMFHIGTEITYKRSGFHIKDKLTDKGWVRVYGPPDDKLGIITASEAQKAFIAEENEIKSNGTSKKREEEKYRLKHAIAEKLVSETLASSVLSAYADQDETHTYFFLSKDIKALKEKEILL